MAFETSSRALSEQEERGRDAAVTFLDLLINQPNGVDRAMELIGDRYRQHNPEVGGGRMTDDDRGVAVVDIFRIEDGRVVEHWDVIQPIPERAANDNGMF